MTEAEQQQMDGSSARVTDAAGYIDIKFQLGPLREQGANGTTIAEVIEVLVTRLEGFQNSPLRCRENALAITHLQDAQNSLARRTQSRIAKGVEGTNSPH